jgi:hypothetical protein
MDETGKPKRRWKLWHFLADRRSASLVVFVAGLFIFVFSLTRPVVDGADAFMNALKGRPI